MNRGVVLYYDDGPTVGFGHRRRMETLGRVLAGAGVDVDCRGLETPAPGDTRIRVVDSYVVRADDGRFDGAPVVAIDDLDRNLAVSLVVHPAPLRSRHRRVRADRSVAGFEYALLNLPDPRPGTRTPVPDSLLVTLGSSDTTGYGRYLAMSIAHRFPDLAVSHAPGRYSLSTANRAVTTLPPSDGLHRALARTQIAVVAGGVTMLEALSLGVPTVVIPTAQNQFSATRPVQREGAAVVVDPGTNAEALVDTIGELLSDPDRQRELGQRGTRLVDGRGAERVANEIRRLG